MACLNYETALIVRSILQNSLSYQTWEHKKKVWFYGPIQHKVVGQVTVQEPCETILLQCDYLLNRIAIDNLEPTEKTRKIDIGVVVNLHIDAAGQKHAMTCKYYDVFFGLCWLCGCWLCVSFWFGFVFALCLSNS